MEFLLGRVEGSIEERPVEGAYKKEFIRVDERSADAPEKIPFYEGNASLWYDKGTNHRVENGHIKRDFKEFAWFIEIDSLGELLEFLARNGSFTMYRSYRNSKFIEIELQDWSL